MFLVLGLFFMPLGHPWACLMVSDIELCASDVAGSSDSSGSDNDSGMGRWTAHVRQHGKLSVDQPIH